MSFVAQDLGNETLMRRRHPQNPPAEAQMMDRPALLG